MATALFEPQTASFGELVLHPRSRRLPDFARWSQRTEDLAAEDEDARRTRNHLFITIGFVAAFMTFLSGVYVVDAAIYPQGSGHSLAATAGPVDYD